MRLQMSATSENALNIKKSYMPYMRKDVINYKSLIYGQYRPSVSFMAY